MAGEGADGGKTEAKLCVEWGEKNESRARDNHQTRRLFFSREVALKSREENR